LSWTAVPAAVPAGTTSVVVSKALAPELGEAMRDPAHPAGVVPEGSELGSDDVKKNRRLLGSGTSTV
jgi:hypothetical protein